jgi:hypothetical protein
MAEKKKTEKAPKADKIDLFDFLGKLSQTNLNYFHGLTANEKKGFSPLVIMRWLSGTSDKKQIQYLNHLINPVVFKLYHHPNLAFKLLMASCTGTSKRFKWVKKTASISKTPLALDVAKRYYRCSSREAKDYLTILTKEEILDLAIFLGEDKSFLDKLKKE